ncbi:MAG: hypothetical protein OXF01_01270 [Gemmatimonadetes bacterium]|nr:hypothetical protein [Gemmatimonadota bacterium]
MRNETSYPISSLFGIVAVNGILMLSPSPAFGASAPEALTDGGAAMPKAVAVAEVAVNLGCALLETAAVAQESQDGSECRNQDGSVRGCTPSEELRQCGEDAVDAVRQCIDGARGLLGRVGCEIGYVIDIAACVAEAVEEAVEPFKGLYS